MLVLFETSLGFCIFKVADEGKIDGGALHKSLATPAEASNLLKLQSIHRFSSTAEAVEDMTAVQEGKLSKSLKRFLTEEVQGKAKQSEQTLMVSDPKLGGAIAKKLSLKVVSDSTTQDMFRGIREHLAELLGDSDVDESSIGTMSLGLSHSLSRYKLKFSPDKVDTMVVQAIALLDDLDKELNIYAMRVKEWYGWHFPEMAKIITDNLAYAKCIKAMGYRSDAAKTDFSAILPEDLEELLKAAAVISMGTEISFSDLTHIHLLVDQVISIAAYRGELSDYLRNRMAAIAPNMTVLVGELVGARLISHAGSLLSLAKQPASTIQILGAEKALFRALKTKHDTPKYGLIFHASLVGQAPQQLKGKAARMVAAKTALAVRVDALSEDGVAPMNDDGDEPVAATSTVGIEGRAKLERRMRQLEQGLGIVNVRRAAKVNGAGDNATRKFEMRGNGAGYNTAADSLIPTAPPPVASTSTAMAVDDEEEDDAAAKAKRKEEKREKKRRRAEAEAAAAAPDAAGDADEEAAKKERKRAKKEAKRLAEQAMADAAADDAATAATTLAVPENGKVSKKRKSTEAPDGGDDDKAARKAAKKARKEAERAANGA